MMRDRTERVLFLITIDTECDHDPDWRRSSPLTFHSITDGLPNRLQPAFESVGAIPTYLLTVEVMEDPASVAALRALEGSYEFGTHLHAAFVEPSKKHYDYAGIASPDFQCHLPPEIEHAKLANLTALFEQRFGYAPGSFRAGRYGAGPKTIESLARLGYLVDTSVTPYLRWPHPDGAVDYRRAPEQPYVPCASDLARPATDGVGSVLEIPVTMQPRWLRAPRWLRPWFSSADQMRSIIGYQLRRHARQRTVVLNMMFHSMEVIPKASPYPQSEDDVRRFIDDMMQVLRWCRELGIEFARTRDVPALLGRRPSTSG